MDKTYIEVVRLLLESAPAIFETPHFAMKGGTAINLFVEDMPRLSVDIDVVYTDHQATRAEALKSISTGLEAARQRLTKAGLDADISATKDGDEIKMFIRRDRNQVKVEVNHLFRGTVLPVWAGTDRREYGEYNRRNDYLQRPARRYCCAAFSGPEHGDKLRRTGQSGDEGA